MANSAKPATKSEILSNIAEAAGLSRKQVASVFDALSGQVKAAVGKKEWICGKRQSEVVQ